MTAVRIAPSILTADFGHLADQIAAAEAAGVDLFHLDVMDGHFVPQLSFGPEVVRAVRAATRLPLEVHMMVAEPRAHFVSFADAGADTLIFHLEAEGAAEALVEEVRALGCRAGVAINPETPARAVEPLLAALDQVTVMLVNPGRGGQEMLVEHLEKVRALRAALDAAGRAIPLEVDGGVKVHNAAQCVQAGADLLVAGSAVYNDREPPQQAVAALRRALGT